MVALLPDRLPWFVAGPAIGLLIVALYAVGNRPLGVSGAYLQVTSLVRGHMIREPWRLWFLAGVLAGALLATFLRGAPPIGTGYGVLGQLLSPIVLVPALFLGGLLMGFGARWAGGCTSGHGLSGSAILSPASLAAAATFMATAVAVTALLHALTGGAL